eukprot:c19876_g1_i4.p1 GENE.c19876_g1_i4~~c19876_g1_i4.p1  ORF type:complete len:354 (+),score=109.02 c19876_g1_i4:421-1482(+)
MSDPAWEHLQLVMEFFLRFIVCPDVDPKVLKKHIDHSFILNLISLFDSEEVREREFLRTILHRLYGKITNYRTFIRKAIADVFDEVIANRRYHFGIGELLEILASIINGFAVPLKDEHKSLLIKNIIPLHKMSGLITIHTQLSTCILQYCQKDQSLIKNIINPIIGYWPHLNSSKQALLILEIVDILDITDYEHFKPICVSVLSLLGRCMNSVNYQIGEKSIKCFENEKVLELLKESEEISIPLLYPFVREAADNHWHKNVAHLATELLSTLKTLSTDLYETAEQKYNQTQSEKSEMELNEQEWKLIENLALSQPNIPTGWKPPQTLPENIRKSAPKSVAAAKFKKSIYIQRS